MSRTIDERVVSMQFDNKQFETNVHTSLSTLEKLKQSLNFKGASKGLEDINASVKKVDMSSLGNACQTVGLKFSAMYTIADQALRNITTRVQQTAERITKAFTIDPIKTGLSEYETQINAVQTILANTKSKGTNLDDVNRALDELNTYADKTIYNFTEMTRNIGTFTAAGVDLDKSVTSIKGIANLAAVSGSTSQQASTAMYQLSQALATGTVKLMDWNSVVNAGMGGEVFQTALKRTATQMGHNVDALIEKYGSFRESLTQGNWLTAEVLTETLTQLSGAYTKADLISQGYSEKTAQEIIELAETAESAATDVKTFTQLMDTLKESAQSGWTQTWELIIGDFEEAKSLWSKVSEEIGGFINATSESRNKLLGGALTSNWDKMIAKINEAGIETSTFEEKLKELLESDPTSRGRNVDDLIKRYGSLEQAFQKGAVSSKWLKKALEELSKSSELDLSSIDGLLKFGSKGDDVKKAQQALKDLGYDLGKWGVDGIIGSATTKAIKEFQKLKGLKVDGIIGPETLKALEEASKKTGKVVEGVDDLIDGITKLGGRELLIKTLANVWTALKKPILAVKNAWREVFSPMTSEQLYKIIEALHAFSEKLIMSDESAEKVGSAFKGLFAVLEILTTIAGGGLKLAFKGLSAILEHFDLNILDVVGAAGDALVKFRDWIFENNILAKGFDKVIGWAAKGAVAIRDWVKAFAELPIVKVNFIKIKQAFSETFTELGEKAKGSWAIFKEFFGNIKSMDSFSLSGIWELFGNFKDKLVEYFSNMGNPFEKIVTALKNFKDAIKKYLGEAGIKFDEIKTKISNFVKMVKEKLGDNMGSILAIGTLLVFIFLVKKIKDAVTLIAKPLDMVDDFLDGLGKTLNSFFKAKAAAARTEALKNIATAITMLAASVTVLALLPQDKVWSAVGAIVVLGGALVGMSFALSKFKPGDLGKLSLAMLGLAGSFLIIGLAVKIIGNMDGDALIKGGLAVAAFLGIVLIIAKSTTDLSKWTTDFGKMMFKLSTALLMLALVVKIFGSMDTMTLLKGGGAVAVFLGMIVGMMAATQLVGLGNSIESFGKMMLKLSTALILMSIAVKILGSMETSKLVKGGIAVGVFLGMMVGMMAATKLLGKDVPKFGGIMLSLSGSLILMAGAIWILGSIDDAKLERGSKVVVAFTGIIIGLMAATKLLGRHSFNAGKFGLMILSMATSIVIIAGAILLLSAVGDDNLKKALTAVAGIGVILAGLIIVTKFAKNINTGTIIGLGISIAILAASIAALSFIDKNKLKNATVALSAIIGMFSLLTYVTKFANKKSLLTIGVLTGVVAGIAYILYLLTDKIKDADAALKAATAISVIITALSASCALLAVASKYGPKTWKGFGIMAAVAGLVGIFAGIAIWQLPKIGTQLSKFMENLKPFIEGAKDIDSEMITGLKTLGQAMLLFTGAGGIFAIVDIVTFGGVSRAFKSFVNFIKEVIPVIKDLAMEVSGEGVKINSANLNAVVDAVGALADASSKVPSTKIVAAFGGNQSGFGVLLGISAPMLSEFASWVKKVIPAIEDLALELSANGVKINAEALYAVCSSVGTLAEAADKAPKLTAGIGVGGGKGIWGGFLAISVPQLKRFATWLEDVIPIMSGFAVDISESKIDSADTKAIVSICEGVKVLAEAADKAPSVEIGVGGGGGKGFGAGFVAIKIHQLARFIEWLQDVIPVMSGFTTDIVESKIKSEHTEALVSICEGVKTLAEAADKASSIDIIGGAGGGKGIGAGLVGISVPQLGRFTKWLQNVIPIMSGFTGIIAESKVKAEHAEALVSICEGVKVLGEAADKAPGIGVAIGGGGGKSFGAGFVAVSVPQLSRFTTWMQDVIPIMSGFTGTIAESKVKAEHAEALVSICEGVKALGEAATNAPGVKAAAGFAVAGPVIAGGVGLEIDNIKTFKDWIEKVGPVMSGFSVDLKKAEITDDDAASIKSICEAVKILGEAAKAGATETNVTVGGLAIGPAIAGFVSVKTEDLTSFKTWIEGVAPVISDFATNVKETSFTEEDGTRITQICNAVRILGEAAGKAPTKEEYSSWFSDKTTETDFGGFTEWIDTILTTLNDIGAKLAEAGTVIDTGTLTALANSAKLLSEGIKAFSEGLNVQIFSPELFVEAVTQMADAMVTFSEKVAGIDTAAVNSAAGAAKNIADTFSIATSYGSDYSSVDTAAFKTKALELAGAISEFGTSMEGVNISTAAAQVSAMVTMLNDISTGNYSGTDGFVTAINTLGTAKVSEFVSAFSDSETISAAGVSLIDNLISGINSGAESIPTAMSTIMTSCSTAISGSTQTFYDAGTTLMTRFGDSILAYSAKIQSICSVISVYAGVGLKSGWSSFYDAGKYVVSGFSSGITVNTFKAEAAAAAMAKKAYEAAKEALDVNSPSKIFRSLGGSVPEGFAMGIDRLGGMVKNSAVAMADTAIKGTKRAIARIADTIDSDINVQPTIRPVIDLSNVEAGAGAINGMLNLQPSVGSMARLSSISAMMNNRQNGANSDVISAIENLGKKLGATSGDTYNINGVTYDDGSNITDAVKTLVRAARVERRM